MGVNAYVRKTGSSNNGGSSSGASPDSTGTTGASNTTTTFTDASANWQPSDVGKLINIVTKGRFQITARASTTSITLSAAVAGTTSNLTWNIGGACLLIQDILGNANSCLCQASSNDTLWIGAGTYRELLSISLTPGSTNTLTIQGDTDGAQTGDVGIVYSSGYLTDDKTAPSNTAQIALGAKNYVTVNQVAFVAGGSGALITGTGNNITFNDCPMMRFGSGSGSTIWTYVATVDIAAVILFNRCTIFAGQASNNQPDLFTLTVPTSTVADYNINFNLTNCRVTCINGGRVISVTATGANSFKGGGVVLQNSTCIGGGAFATLSANVSTTAGKQCLVYNCILISTGTALNGNAASQIVEDYNRIVSATPRTNVSTGTHSISDNSYAPIFHIGQELLFKSLYPMPFLSPTTTSPYLGFGNENSAVTAPTVDALNRPRPSGPGITWANNSNAIGAFERHDVAKKDTVTVDVSPSIKMVGPMDQEIRIPVPASATVISIKVQRDGSYGAGTKPQITLLANGEIGVVTQTVTDVAASGQWNTLTLASFTPTAAGVVILRLDATGSAGAGNTYWDTLVAPTLSAQGGTDNMDFFFRGELIDVMTHDAAGGAVTILNSYKTVYQEVDG